MQVETTASHSCFLSEAPPTSEAEFTKKTVSHQDSSLEQHLMVMERIAELEKILSSRSWEEKDLSEYGILTNRRFTVLAGLSIPNGILNDSSQQVPIAIVSSFVDRLSLSANLLLDHRPELLEGLHLPGSTTFFFGNYVISNYLKSEEFQVCLSTLGGENKKLVREVSGKFHTLAENYKVLSAHFNALTILHKKNFRPAQDFLEKMWKEQCEKESDLLFPLGWRFQEEEVDSCHFYLAYVDKCKSRFHVINTSPNDEQDYKVTGKGNYEQNCSITLQANNIGQITKNLFKAAQYFNPDFSGDAKDWEKSDEDDLITHSTNLLKKNCQVLPCSRTPLTKISLNFGYSCTLSTFQALFQTLLMEEILPKQSRSTQWELKCFPEVWMLGLKLYVLRNFQSEIMHLGEENFPHICADLEAQFNFIEKYSFTDPNLDELFKVYNSIKGNYLGSIPCKTTKDL